MSRNYDNWEKLVGAVLRSEKDRQLAYCESFSTSYSADLSSRFSFDSAFGDVHHLPPVSTSSRHKLDPTDPSSENVFLSRNVKAIEFKEIRKATKNFRRDLYLGEGGFGPVFKGRMGSGIAVAVKMLSDQGLQGHDEWVEEINYLSQLHHPNLVQLIGYSFYSSNRFLVYEFMPKGSLDKHLFARRHESLPWATRMKVAVGAARAIAFLHGLEIPVIHRNIKSDDIFLDADFNPKLSDFGLAIDGPTGDMTHVETKVVSTCGYGAPEYVATEVDHPDLSSQNIFISHDVMAMEFEEIRKATRNFRPSNMLGGGLFSCVYKGWIDKHYAAVSPGSGIAVAVKVLNNTRNIRLNKWMDELNNLSQLRHPNLLTPIGYSFDTDQRVLIYEFMPNGSLDNHLFRSRQQLLPWATRIKVAVGAARALAFLHDLEIPVIYRILKICNIILDGDFNPKLSGIGLAKDVSRHKREGVISLIDEVSLHGPYGSGVHSNRHVHRM